MTANEPPFDSRREPWVNADGSTNVNGWLAAYADDDNTFWRTDTGHIMNVVDALIERLDGVKEQWLLAEQRISELEAAGDD